MVYAWNDDERDKPHRAIRGRSAAIPASVRRYKGLGERRATLGYLVNENRTLRQVTIENAAAATTCSPC